MKTVNESRYIPCHAIPAMTSFIPQECLTDQDCPVGDCVWGFCSGAY